MHLATIDPIMYCFLLLSYFNSLLYSSVPLIFYFVIRTDVRDPPVQSRLEISDKQSQEELTPSIKG